MKTAAAYIRVSTEEQTELSPDSQIRMIRDYAKAHDMVLPESLIFADEGISGRSAEKRPAFMRMITAAKTTPRPFDVILLWKFSRFARSREDSIVYKSLLRKQCGIEVISISEQLTDDKTSILIEALLEAMDEYYSINLGEEVKRGMREKAERGGAVSAPAYGYDMENGRYIVNEAEARWVRWLFAQFLSGAGTRELAIRLNEEGAKSKRGGLWENRSVEYILKNPVYTGKIRWSPQGRAGRQSDGTNSILVKGLHTPIIDDNTYEAAQRIFAQQKRLFAKYAHQISKHDYMLRGLVRCSDCMSTLILSNGGLQCYSYAHGVCRSSHYISLSTANELLLAALEDFLATEEYTLLEPAARQAPPGQEELDSAYSRLKRAKDAYEAGIDSLEEYRSNKTRLEERIKQLRRRTAISIKSLDEQALDSRKQRGILMQLKDSNVSEKEKNLLLRSFVDHIVFDRAKSAFTIYLYI